MTRVCWATTHTHRERRAVDAVARSPRRSDARLQTDPRNANRGGRKTTSRKRQQPDTKRDPHTLVHKLPNGKTEEQCTADLVVEGVAINAFAVHTWAAPLFKSTNETAIDLTSLVAALADTVERTHRGSLADAEALLMSQAVVLNAIFVHLGQLGKHATLLDPFERHMRLAFKAQAQCRATCETLAALKNPPVFAHQTNIAAGQQQVNNGPVVNGTPARAAIQKTAPNKLLEADGERLDLRTQGTTGRGDQAVATVGTLDRTTHSRGQGTGLSQRLPRR